MMLPDSWAMHVAANAAQQSKDQGRKVGCVLMGDDWNMITVGYNELAANADDLPQRRVRPAKLDWTEHAERNAIYAAARAGKATFGATAYTTLHPCPECARALVQSGIARLVCPEPDLSDPNWGERFAVSREILKECGITVEYTKFPEPNYGY